MLLLYLEQQYLVLDYIYDTIANPPNNEIINRVG